MKPRKLWIGFLAALLPLLLVLALQYWWLKRLEETTALAGRAILSNFLEAVSTEILYVYGPAAERTLDVPASLFTQGPLDRAALHFRRRSAEGVKTLFVVRFETESAATTLFYDSRSASMERPEPSDELRAVTVACAPWRLMHDKGIEVDSARLVVEERDTENRIILNPILDNARVVGAAGMILDTSYFRSRLLPATISGSLPKFFSGDLIDSPVVTVRDRGGHLEYGTGAEEPGGTEDVTRPFSFVFTDWRLGVHGRGRTPEQWARASFAFNVSLSTVAGGLLVCGLALALRTASREMKLSRMKSDFVSNVSHELRTPLASIRVFGEFLRLGRAETPEKVREYGEYIETESRRLTQLIDNILDFAKIEAGQKTYRFEVADVTEILAGVVHAFAVRLKRTGFEIDFRRPDQPIPSARVDASALGQAFHNLLDNAVLYSGDSRWIGVSIASRHGEIVASVEDHGIGIPKDEQAKIFERFHRVGAGLVHEVRGTGLGLSIVQHIVRAHSGRVTLESEPGRGSVFSIHLPAVAQPAEAEVELGDDSPSGSRGPAEATR